MTQDEINKAEWENPDNWTKGSKLLCVYFSQKDSRTWVPKRIPWMGSTINLGKVAGVAWLTGFFVGLPIIFVIIMFLLLNKT